MLALISLLAVLVGCANWLTIGLLQFDFVAGIFGSQSNIFSRIIYVVIGVCAIVLTVNIIKNKGRIAFNFRKLKAGEKQPALAPAESGQDYAKENNNYNNYHKVESNSTENQQPQQYKQQHQQYQQPQDQKFHQSETKSYMGESSQDSSKSDFRSLSNQLRDRQNYNKNLRNK